MDEQQRIIAVDSSSNSSPIMFSKKNEVFISFLDEGTCSDFTRRLFSALNRKSVKTYIDYQLKKDSEISPAVTKAIEDSRVSIVIFSRNYASSKWCLDELSKIMECRKFQGMVVVPVFHDIHPSHVTNQTGSYEQAFAKHEGETRCSQWRANLTEAANLPGWDSRIYWIESGLIEKVVEAVLQELPPRRKSPPTYHVFLSFRGDDTWSNFTSHLYKALKYKKVKAYIDYQLRKGDDISPALTKAIEDSYISIVIFSENYASSKWCLGELSKILECKKVQEQIVIPVFYNIDPTHVRKQTGSYNKAFAKHEGDPRCNKWRSDLTEAANLVGFDSQNRIETEFLKDIVEDVLKKLAHMYPNLLKKLIGIEPTYEQIESLLEIGSSEVKTLGIWGMGGIGKTTLATTLYDNLSCKFEGCCFLENVRERSNKIEDLCDELFSKLLKNKNHGFGNFEISRLKHKKVFIVLDDVASSKQLDRLINGYDFLGPGSRVIVTARDKQILAKLDEIYQLERLSSGHSIQLLYLSAFFAMEDVLHGLFHELYEVVSYCKGIPLALKVLGASLNKKSKYTLKFFLRKLKFPNFEIHEVLRFSYDGLDPYEQDIFLDIACFFKGWDRDRLTSLLEACGFHPESEIDSLLDKSLVTISDDNRVEMHDLIQEMGWMIVDEEDIKDPGKRSRLWRHGEVLDALKCNKVTTVVEGIIFDLCELTRDLDLSSISLANMTNVRCLMIHDSSGTSNEFKVCLPNGQSLLPNKLRCLHWDRFCLDSFPPTFCAEHLVELRMRDSKLKKLWDGVQDLVNLKTIDLSYSRNLIEIPDLSKADNLESVYLIDCESLCQLHVQSKSLCVVRLDGCSSLEEFSMTSVEIRELNLANTAICALPSSIWCSTKLASLSLKGWKDLSFVENISHLSSLEELDLSGTNIVEINPEIFEKLPMLKRLRLDDCDKLKSLQKLSLLQKFAPRYPINHHVFLSFRGADTRLNFTSHLYKALVDEGVKAYIDYQLEKGDEISLALANAIEDSYISVVIFSENYASSKWCLGELSKILECKKVQEQIVIPVFYNIDPTHVRKQTGSYNKAFAKHEGDPRCNKWRSDLTEAANLAGFNSRGRIETEFIKDIVKDVLKKLPPMNPNQRKRPIGIEQNYNQSKSLLEIESSKVKKLGIWGMGGIGKTTLATTLFDNMSSKFHGRCFLANVQEGSLEKLHYKLFSKLLKKENLEFDDLKISRLKEEKVFIVLDDVATSEQLDKLIYEHDHCLGPGSRVIVTARDKQILAKLDEIYQVEELSSDHSLQLFCSNAFGKERPADGFEDLSSRVVSYCKGIPLALKVLGASLCKKKKEIWQSKLSKLGEIPNLEIYKVLKLSYDGLEPKQQDIFLDIACFFKGWHKDRLTSLLKACGFHPESEIDTLLDKSLITISDDKRIEMHDLIQEMGWKVVDEEDIKDPGKRSRLWRHGEVLDALKCNKKVTTDVEGIIFDLCKLTRHLSLSSSSLANMTNMRYLMIHDSSGGSDGFKVCLPNGESSLSDKLRCLYWDRFCLESLPPTFCAEHLVELRMRDSNLKKLWDGVQDLVNLKTIDLSYSRNLIEIPDLSKADKLESVYLIDCERVCKLHVQSKSLSVVRLDGCSSLEEFSVTSEEIIELNLANTAICALPSSIWCSRKLASFSLKGWKDLTFVENIVHLSLLEELDLSGTNIVEINPKIFENLSMLRRLRLDDCEKLKSLPELPKSLQEVSAVNCTSLDTEITQQLVLLHMLHNQCPCHFIFPGNHFIEDCKFHSEARSITIDCLPKSNFRGLIYCVILSKHGKGFRTIPVSYSICQDDIQIVRDDKAMACRNNLISDHVLFSYVDISRFDRISEVRDNFSVIFEFDHYNQERIKGCGLFPVYATERGFNKLMESPAELYEPELDALRREMKRARTSE